MLFFLRRSSGLELLRSVRASSRCGFSLMLLAVMPGLSAGQTLGPTRTFPGDRLVGPSTGIQKEPALAAGGPGFLAVWEDRRANLSGTINAAGNVAAGNMTDIHAARFDASGNLLDTTPIVIANQGHNQTEPAVAWNGSNWLVVWTTQRHDFYFFEDIVGVRVAPDGTVLDDEPITIRPETNSPSNNYGENPSVGSDGTNWLVAWEAIDFTDNKAIVQGTRLAADGSVLDPNFVTLYKFNSLVFGPEFPRVASVNGEYLVAWNNFGPVLARRFDRDLTPLGPAFGIPGLTGEVSLAASGSQYMVLATLEAVRLDASGAVLDSTPIVVPNAAPVIVQGAQVRRPEVAWTGTQWAVAYSVPITGSVFDDSDIWLVRIDADGVVLDANPIQVDPGPHDDVLPAVAGDGSGNMLFAYQSSNFQAQRLDDVHATYVSGNGVPGPQQEVALGLPRQEHIEWVRGGGVHLALYSSKSSGSTRILAQRFSDSGTAIDLTPVLVHQGAETARFAPSGAWNGSHYFVAWEDATGLILGRRLTPNLQVLGFGATPLMSFMDGPPDVGALGADFLVAVSDEFSGDQRVIRGVRVNGATGAPIDAAPFTISANYAFGPEVEALGSNWIVAWSSRPRHDSPTVRVFARFVSPSGGFPLGAPFVVNGTGEGIDPAIAVAGNEALIAYDDESAFLQDDIEGRILRADGSFRGGEFVIANETGRQMFPTAGYDGTQYVIAWADYRAINGVEQMRADVYAARVALDGTLLDPGGGFSIQQSVLPEDFPAVTTGSASTLIGFLALDGLGGVPEIQRAHFREFGERSNKPVKRASAPSGIVNVSE